MLNVSIPIDENLVIAAIERAAERVTRDVLARDKSKEDRLINVHEVMHLTGLSRSAIYKSDKLPRPVILEENAKRWRLSEIMAHIERAGK